MTTGWDTLGGRLRWAIDKQPPDGRQRGLRLFQRRMTKRGRGVVGTSLSAVQAYLSDEAEPSLSFLRLAAELLSVRFAWLVVGQGAPTQEEQAGRLEVPEAELFRISTAVYEALGVPTKVVSENGEERNRFWGSAVWAPVVRQTVLRIYQNRPAWDLIADREVEHPSTGPSADASWDAAIADTAATIAAPLHTLGIEARYLTSRDVEDYVQAVSLTLQRVANHYVPQEGAERESGPLSRALIEPFIVTKEKDPDGEA